MRLDQNHNRPRGWLAKFRNAFRGVALGVSDESSYRVHFFISCATIVTAIGLHVSTIQWCLLVLCITIVLAAEMFNSAIERLAKAIDLDENEFVGSALDIAAGAVLLAALGASVTGIIVFSTRLVELSG